MNSKPIMIVSGVIVALILLVGACATGFVAGQIFNTNSISSFSQPAILPEFDPGPTEHGGTPEELDVLFQPFWQTWDLVVSQYVDQPVDQEVMMRGAIKGMLEALGDQHTSYLDPDMYERANAHLDGEEYEGIGAWVDISGDYLTIISPMPGSPAEQAGLKPNDRVIAIDGDDMAGIDGELVRQRIIGPRGTTVILTIVREGVEEPFDVSIKRDSILVPTVEGEMMEGNIAYVHLYTFGDETAQDMRDILDELMAQEPSGLVLDLRMNGGGYLETAIDVVSEYIDEGVVMIEEFGDGTQEIYKANKGGMATEIPIVVLINEGSASASEIVAGAIQDRQRGVLVGTTSFGKGSVQHYSALVNDQGAVRVTIARWLTPEGRQIHGVGLEPDHIVIVSDEDIEADIDPQLEKAIELLLKP